MLKIRFSNFGTTCTTGMVNHIISEDQTEEFKSCIKQEAKEGVNYE